MKQDIIDRIKDVWTQWLTKDIHQWLSFPKAIVQTYRILDGKES